MTRTLLLFDIDGTLLLSGGAGIRAMADAGAQLFGDGFSLDGFDLAGKLDPVIYRELADRHGIDDAHLYHDAFRDLYLSRLRSEIARTAHHVHLMPGILDTLTELRRRNQQTNDAQLGLLSGNYREAVPIKFTVVGLDPAWFQITALGDDAPSRPELTLLAMRKYEAHWREKADPKHVVVIGDTPHDVHCAKAHGCVSFCVATGRYSIAELDAAGADIAVENLSDPTPLFDLIG